MRPRVRKQQIRQRRIDNVAKRLDAWKARQPEKGASKKNKDRFEFVQHKQVERAKREIEHLEKRLK